MSIDPLNSSNKRTSSWEAPFQNNSKVAKTVDAAAHVLNTSSSMLPTPDPSGFENKTCFQDRSNSSHVSPMNDLPTDLSRIVSDKEACDFAESDPETLFGEETSLEITSDSKDVIWHKLSATKDIKTEQITSLKISIKDISSEDFIEFIKFFNNLKSLDVSGCYKLTDQAIIFAAEHCHDLEYFDASWCWLLTDQSILAIANHCRRLKCLDLSYCILLTDQPFLAIANHCHSLRYLGASWCWLLTDQSILAIMNRCRDLEGLDLSWCCKLTNQVILAIPTLRKLEELDVRGCNLLIDQAFLTSRISAVGLEILVSRDQRVHIPSNP